MHRWYILRTSDGNSIEFCELMQSQGLRAFVPTEYRPAKIGEEKVWQQEPSQPGLLFAYGTYDDIHKVIKNTTLHFVHQSDVKTENGILPTPSSPLTTVPLRQGDEPEGRRGWTKNRSPLSAQYAPITVPDDSMDNFIRLVNVGLPQSYSVTDAEIHYRPGGPVRITDGPFKGIVGRVARIHTQTRVVVSIPGIISFATTYIPKHQMEAIDI